MQRELKRLADSGLVTVSRVGNQKHYQGELRLHPFSMSFVTWSEKPVGVREPIRGGTRFHGKSIEHAAVYGSVAKQTDTATSDVDLLVVSDDLTLQELYAALAPVEESLSRKSIRRCIHRESSNAADGATVRS